MPPFMTPQHRISAFNCPSCGAYAQQHWSDLFFSTGEKRSILDFQNLESTDAALCTHCHQFSFWINKRMIFPSTGIAPLANPDLPEDIKNDYEEARSIASLSPRGAAALLRLAIQKLCKHLGEKGEHLNTDIANLVKKGLPPQVQQALDIVRVIGNNSVHPGQIDLTDDSETVQKLFGLVNIIAQVMITQPKQIGQLYESLPDNQLEAIAKRDQVV